MQNAAHININALLNKGCPFKGNAI